MKRVPAVLRPGAQNSPDTKQSEEWRLLIRTMSTKSIVIPGEKTEADMRRQQEERRENKGGTGGKTR